MKEFLNEKYNLLGQGNTIAYFPISTTYEFQGQATGFCQRFVIDEGIELAIFKNCTYTTSTYYQEAACRNLMEITALLDGEFYMTRNQEVFHGDKGQMIYFDWSKPYDTQAITCEHVTGISLFIHKDSLTVGDLTGWFFAGKHTLLHHQMTTLHKALVQQLLTAYEENYSHYFLMKAKVLELLHHMLQSYAVKTGPVSFDQRIQGVLQHIHTKYKEPLQVQSLAAQYYLSTVNLQTYFKDQYHCTVYQYLQKYRMTVAADLLLQTTAPVIDIAYQVGYENPSKFAATFKKHYGLTPLHYRQTYFLMTE